MWQLSAFQETIRKLWDMTPDPASESSKPLFQPGNEVLIKTLGSGSQSLKPSGKALIRLFFLLPQLSRCQELIPGCSILELKSGTLTKTKQCHFLSLSSMFSHFAFQMGLIIYVSLLPLTPKILSLSFDPQDNAFLSWAHSYTAFHNLSYCWVCTALPPSSVEGFPWRVSPFQGKDFPQLYKYLHQQQSRVMPLF